MRDGMALTVEKSTRVMRTNPSTTKVNTVNKPVCALCVMPATKAYLRHDMCEKGTKWKSHTGFWFKALHGWSKDATHVADSRRESIAAKLASTWGRREAARRRGGGCKLYNNERERGLQVI